MRAISSRACPTPRAFSPWPVCAFATGTPHAGIVLPEWLVSSSVSSRLPQEHSGTAVSLVGPRLRSQPSAAPLLRKFQFLPSPPPPLWHPAYADSSASRQTARWTHVNKGLQASMSSASTSSSYCLKNEVYKIKMPDTRSSRKTRTIPGRFENAFSSFHSFDTITFNLFDFSHIPPYFQFSGRGNGWRAGPWYRSCFSGRTREPSK